jgi:hypothetical protein
MINFDLLVQFELTVMPDGMPPYPATIQQSISQMQVGQLRAGLTLQATVDLSNPTSAIFLDLAAFSEVPPTAPLAGPSRLTTVAG